MSLSSEESRMLTQMYTVLCGVGGKGGMCNDFRCLQEDVQGLKRDRAILYSIGGFIITISGIVLKIFGLNK